MKKYSNLTLALPTELYEFIKEYKQRNFVSLSALVTKLLQDWRTINNV